MVKNNPSWKAMKKYKKQNEKTAEAIKVYKDLRVFLKGQEESWGDFCGMSLVWGSLLSVLEFTFVMSPDKDEAVRIITEAMSEFTEKGES